MFRASDFIQLLQRLEQFFAESSRGYPVIKPQDPTSLKQNLDLSLPREADSIESIHHDIDQYLNYAVATAHPMYFNQLWGGVDPVCLMGELLTSAANTSMYTYEVAPIATLIEKELISKLGSLVGFSDPEGQFTTGGSNGNLMALAMARHHADPTIKQQGISQPLSLVALVSEDSHYSFAKAADLLGIGIQNLWKVPTDAQGRMIVAEAENLIMLAKHKGKHPFFIAGTAGTTVRGAFDPFHQIAELATREDLWFHVDGAWGAGVLLSPTHRILMQGAEQADSLVWDAHKMMGMTLMCSVLLVKQRGSMAQTFSTSGASYIFHDGEEETLDLGPSTMHCGRRADAIKLWLSWKALGDLGWQQRIEGYFDLAYYAEQIISESSSLRLVAPRQSVNLCFQYIPRHPRTDPNLLNKSIRQVLIDRGIAMVNYAQIKGETVFRLVICNQSTTREDLDYLFSSIICIGQELDSHQNHLDAHIKR